MAYVYSTAQSFGDSNKYGNVAMEVNVYRGDVTRKENSVSFDFGVSFKPTHYTTSNSIAAWYDGEQRFAYSNSGYSFDNAPVKGKHGVTHYAYYTDRKSTRACTSEKLCYSYSSSSVDADTTSVKISIGVGWIDWAGTKMGTLTFSVPIPEYHGNGSVSKPAINDKGNNTFTISGSITNGINNKFKSAKVYYTTNGSVPTTSSSYKVPDSAGNYSFTINIPSSSSSSVIKAFISCTFSYNVATSAIAEKTVYYYTNGSVPPTPTITDNGNNTFTISGKVSKAGTNNPIKSSTLYYSLGANAWQSRAVTTTSEGSYSISLGAPSSSATPTIRAQSECIFGWGSDTDSKTRTSGEAVKQVKYYTAIGRPNVSITDNYNNTFTISGTNAANGTNNTASTTYQWGYSTSYGNSGTGTKSLSIATPANATRTVYVKATATPSWRVDSAKTASVSLEVKQYVAPSNPGKPTVSYTKSRPTIKENWTFTWTAPSAANNSSPVKGYRVVLQKNGVSIPIKNTSGTVISSNPSSADWHTLDTSGTSLVIDPVKNGFLPGDTVRIGVKPYTQYGNTNTGAQLFNSDYTYSDTIAVQNAGIVHVKVAGADKEGQVYVKVNGAWQEAETVSVKVNGAWKESQ